MGKPDVIMLEEPTNALNKTGVKEIRKIILEEKERGALNKHLFQIFFSQRWGDLPTISIPSLTVTVTSISLWDWVELN